MIVFRSMRLLYAITPRTEYLFHHDESSAMICLPALCFPIPPFLIALVAVPLVSSSLSSLYCGHARTPSPHFTLLPPSCHVATRLYLLFVYLLIRDRN